MALMRRNHSDMHLERARDHIQGALKEMNRNSQHFAEGARKRSQMLAARSSSMMADTRRQVERHPWSSAGIIAVLLAAIAFLLFRRNGR